MIIGRALMAIGLGLFWILAGQGAGYPATGFVFGIVGATFIWCWTYPWRNGPT
jgi:hypothetical protein